MSAVTATVVAESESCDQIKCDFTPPASPSSASFVLPCVDQFSSPSPSCDLVVTNNDDSDSQLNNASCQMVDFCDTFEQVTPQEYYSHRLPVHPFHHPYHHPPEQHLKAYSLNDHHQKDDSFYHYLHPSFNHHQQQSSASFFCDDNSKIILDSICNQNDLIVNQPVDCSTLIDIPKSSLTFSCYYPVSSIDSTWITVEQPSYPPIDATELKGETFDWLPISSTTSNDLESTTNENKDYFLHDPSTSNETCHEADYLTLNLDKSSSTTISSSTDNISDPPNNKIHNDKAQYHRQINPQQLNCCNINLQQLSGNHPSELANGVSSQSSHRYTFLSRSFRYQNSIGRVRGGNLLSKEEQRVNACKREESE